MKSSTVLSDEVLTAGGELRKLYVMPLSAGGEGSSLRRLEPGRSYYSRITDRTMRTLARQQNCPLEMLTLSSCAVTETGVALLVKASSTCQLLSLDRHFYTLSLP